MKIKEIKLYGFKSFPNETKLVLNAGITAFVGPNGSGKSNIFDALRWVFGEQSMKALRCERIEDLIFISPDAQNDAHFTEVALIIDNEDYFPQFGGEFEIKRRFYRSGESEFFLNRVKCRLQDIQALFLNSGTLTYSFLELSEIEKIIHGNTKDMFNDVSGILKYEERREQTKKRLEATEQDLLRLEDIIHEMQRSLRSLRRQVRQTRLYQELRDEYKRLTLFLLKREYNATAAKLTDIGKKIDAHEAARQSALQETKTLEHERELLKQEMAQVDEQKRDTVMQIAAFNEKLEHIEKAIEEKEEAVKHMVLVSERTLTSMREKGDMLNANRLRCTDYEQRRSEVLTTIDTMKASIDTEQQALNLHDEEYFSLSDTMKTLDDSLSAFAARLQECEQERARLHYERDNKEKLLARITEEYNGQREELEQKQRQLQGLEEELTNVVDQQDGLAKALEDKQKKRADLEQALSDLENDLGQNQDSLTQCKLNIDTLTNRLKEKGSIKEIESVFETRNRGLVKNSLKVTSGYESIVDICLGDMASYYLVDDYSSHDFVALPDGRFGFMHTRVAPPEKSPAVPEGLQSLAAFVKFKSSPAILQTYISRYFMVDDFNKARALSEEFPDCGFVTPDGILFKHGVIIVEKGDIGYFKINKSLEEHKQELETLQNRMLFVYEEKKRLLAEDDELTRDIEQKRDHLFSINVKKSECSLKLNELRRSLEKLTHDHEGIKKDRDILAHEQAHLSTRIDELDREIERIQHESQTKEEERKDVGARIESLQREIEGKHSSLNEKKLERAALEERLSSLDATIEHLKSEIAITDGEIAALRESAAQLNLNEARNEIQTMKDELTTVKHKKAETEQHVPEKVVEELTQRLNSLFDRLTEKQKIHEEIQNTIMQLKYESFQLSHAKDDAVKKAHDDFHVDLGDYTFDEEIIDAEAKLLDSKGKLEKLGDVNPLSLELYESEKKRLDEFLSQRDDIITAKRSLLKSIEELDSRARERFLSIFIQVKKEFDFVFSNFFEGGQADLVLTEPDNPIASKIDIVVRMKGKRLKTINQLSGGERTLLAISLLLAFYLVKPAPFCILDEIDAPLDDANVVRFNRFLRDLAQRTQVIIITHNRATMEYADYLYGLTMEKPGQSKIISARLADLETIASLD